jgi:hypothetical protein
MATVSRVHPLVTHTQRRGYALPLVLASFRTYANTFGCPAAADATALTVQSHGDDFVKVDDIPIPSVQPQPVLLAADPDSEGPTRHRLTRALRACVGCMQFVESECQRQMAREDLEHAAREEVARVASGRYAEHSVGRPDLGHMRSRHTRPSHGAVARPPPVVQSSLVQHFTPRPLATAEPSAPSTQQDDSRLDDLDLANTKVH